ncbi:MAG: MarR family transcriptional regulator [Bacteroidia bacterium]|nr:MarR family transcriptional regulator [Bacteroidia bacterium]
MGIKREIGQRKPFRDNRHKAIVNLLYTNGWLVGKLRALFKQYDLTEKQYNILRILKGTDKPLTTSVIRNRLLDKMSDTTRVIERMMKKGLVVKKVNKTDRRLVDITLSNKGEQLLLDTDKITIEVDAIATELTLEEAGKLSDLLDKMRG